MILLKSLLLEVGEASAQSYKWEEVDNGIIEFETGSAVVYRVYIPVFTLRKLDARAIEVTFTATTPDPKTGKRKLDTTANASSRVVTNKGELYKVMATITKILKYYVNRYKVKYIMYEPGKKAEDGLHNPSQREELYKAFIKKQIPNAQFISHNSEHGPIVQSGQILVKIK